MRKIDYNRNMNRKTKIALFCISSLILNSLFTFFFFDFLNIPLFMDTIFTVAIVFYLGLIPGLIVGILFNFLDPLINFILHGVFSPTNMCFSICGAAIVLVTWAFARKKEEFQISIPVTILYLLLISLLSSFVTIIFGGTIDFIRFSYYEIPDSMAPIKQFTESFVSQKFSLFASCILAQIPISITDRLITTFAGFAVYKLYEKWFGPGKEL